MQVRDDHVLHLRAIHAQQPQPRGGAAQVLAAAFRRNRRRESGVHDHLESFAPPQPHEISERHRPVVRGAADEILGGAPLVVRVLDREDLVLLAHFMVTRAAFRLPTWITSVSPRLSCRLRSAAFSPLMRTPPCSIMRAASFALGTRPASLSTLRMCVSP